MFRFRTECLPQLMASTSARVCARAGTTKPFQPGIGAVPDSVGVGAAGQRALSIPCGLCAAKPSYALILGRFNICMCLLLSAMHACALAIARHQ